MYYITGADGQEYGPVGLDTLQRWISEGRVNSHTRVRVEGSDAWQPADDLPEVNNLLQQPASISAGPPPVAATASARRNTTLAASSLVLGIFALLCLGPLTGIPAVICGHAARRRVRRAPNVFGGASIALAGAVLGYVSIVAFLAVAAFFVPTIGSRSKDHAQAITCMDNMKMIGMSFRVWAADNNDQFPFNVSTNKGGTLELATQGPDGADPRAYLHLMVISNELHDPKFLVCPADSKRPARRFSELKPANVSYELMTDVTDRNPTAVLAMCPRHGNVLTVDGTVQSFGKPSAPKKRR